MAEWIAGAKDWFIELNPVVQAVIATCGTWLVTALGASLVFFTKTVSQKYLDASLGLAAGVMIAASCWSLLIPAIDMSEDLGYGNWSFIPALVGFIGGAVFLRITDKLLPHFHPMMAVREGRKSTWQRSTLLILAITMHNVPEGMAVGVAFGAAGLAPPDQQFAALGAAVALAIGIGLQNFPEGTAVSFPLRREGMGRFKAFWFGQLSAVVEPMAGAFGAGLVLLAAPILPYALAFAAGAMIFVVAEELVPEAQSNGNVDLATMGVILGFAVMMTLDVALG